MACCTAMRLPLTPASARSLRVRLLRHYDAAARDLPWRRTRDPYRVLVSEMMLQQTTVAAVVPYYEAFVRRFPGFAELAAAPEDAVLEAWAGLGYYRRARHLHAAARAVMAEHAGRLPDSPEALKALPGIGPYTAGAVASIAYGRPAPVLDGNVTRVLSRLAARTGQGASERRVLTAAAAALVRGERPGDLNQALMELGATVCTPRAPRCRQCPVRRSCAAHAAGDPEAYPRPSRRPGTVRRRGVFLLARDGRGRILLVRRPEGGLMPGLWELPGLSGQDARPVQPSPARVALAARRQTGRGLEPGRVLARLSHGVLNRRIEIEVRSAALDGGRLRREGSARWCAPGGPFPALTGAARKALVATGYNPGSPRRSP